MPRRAPGLNFLYLSIENPQSVKFLTLALDYPMLHLVPTMFQNWRDTRGALLSSTAKRTEPTRDPKKQRRAAIETAQGYVFAK